MRQRTARVLPYLSPHASVSYLQRALHVARHGSRVWPIWDRTLSSESIKRDRAAQDAAFLAHAANLYAVTSSDGRLVVMRSARADNAARLEQVITASAIASLQASGGNPDKATGFVRQDDGTLMFRPALLTALDRSPLKVFSQRLAAHFGFIAPELEMENVFLQDTELASDELFAQGPIKRTLQVLGENVTVVLRRPAIVSVTMSFMSAFESAVKLARRANEKAAVMLFDDLRLAWQRQAELTQSPEKAFLATAMQRAQKAGRAGYEAFFDSLHGAGGNLAVTLAVAALPSADRMALDYLCLNMPTYNKRGVDTFSRAHLKRTDPGIEVLLFRALMAVINGAVTVGCKSARDRSAALQAFFVAADAYEVTQKTSLTFADTAEAETALRPYFGIAAEVFGAHVLADDLRLRADGNALKWGPTFVPHRFYRAAGSAYVGTFRWAKYLSLSLVEIFRVGLRRIGVIAPRRAIAAPAKVVE